MAEEKEKKQEMTKVCIRLPWDVIREAKILAMDQRKNFQDVVSEALTLHVKAKRKGGKR